MFRSAKTQNIVIAHIRSSMIFLSSDFELSYLELTQEVESLTAGGCLDEYNPE